MTKASVRFLMVALTGLLLGAPAHADILGSIWEVSASVAEDAAPANVPGIAPTVTFDLPGTVIDFQSNGATDYTIGTFLSTGGATTTSGASQAGDILQNTLFDIIGTVSVTTGETFAAGHDDGLTFIVGSDTVINEPGPTSLTVTTETYTGPAGNLPFQLVYGECCGVPADLEISGLTLSSTSVPEPTSVIFMLTVVLGVALLSRKRIAPRL